MHEIIKVQTVERGYLLNFDIRRNGKRRSGPEVYEDRQEMIQGLHDLLDMVGETEAPATPPPPPTEE